MKLNNLKLTHFKNYENLEVAFSEGINCIVGKNGAGKTNLLDAIHYLSMTRSALNSVDQQNITHNRPYFAVDGMLEAEEKIRIICYYEKGKKKILKKNGQEVEKFSDHIGDVPCVLVAPDDTEMIKEGSETRRKFFDSVISQQNRTYLEALMAMQRLLKQRNSFLKQNEGKTNIDKQLIKVYDEELMPLFKQIASIRKTFIEDFAAFFEKNYQLIFEGEEYPDIMYDSKVLAADFEDAYQNSLAKDILLQRTTMGAHKDDYVFNLNERMVKKIASQGQKKSFIIALKLAEYDYLQELKGFSPILMLDDIFDKLDDERILRLVDLLSDAERFPQVFITDAREERSREIFSSVSATSFYKVSEGKVN